MPARRGLARASVCPSGSTRAVRRPQARLGDRFAFVGYYFAALAWWRSTPASTFGDDMESHYFGLDYEVSRRFELYRSMLYDDIAAAIDGGARRLSFGRTSQEMKSSLGAVPVGMSWFARSGWSLATDVMVRLMRRFTPAGVQHDPFRS